MTSREMQISFSRQLSETNKEFEYPNLLDSDTIFYFINLAQERYLKETYITKSTVKENVEYLNKKIDDLKSLVTRKTMFDVTNGIILLAEPSLPISSSYLYSSTNISYTRDGGLTFPLPDDYFYYIYSSSELTGGYLNKIPKSWYKNRIIDHGDLDKSVITTAINKPIIREPFILLEYRAVSTTASSPYTLILYKDIYSNLFNLELVYIKKPKKLVIGITPTDSETLECELPISAHQEIVDYAVKLFVEDFKYKLSNKASK
jgi:hypothetical protein